MVYRTVRGVALDHIGHDAVIRLAFHLAVAHGADVDTGGALQTSSNMANLAQMSTEGGEVYNNQARSLVWSGRKSAF